MKTVGIMNGIIWTELELFIYSILHHYHHQVESKYLLKKYCFIIYVGLSQSDLCL